MWLYCKCIFWVVWSNLWWWVVELFCMCCRKSLLMCYYLMLLFVCCSFSMVLWLCWCWRWMCVVCLWWCVRVWFVMMWLWDVWGCWLCRCASRRRVWERWGWVMGGWGWVMEIRRNVKYKWSIFVLSYCVWYWILFC